MDYRDLFIFFPQSRLSLIADGKSLTSISYLTFLTTLLFLFSLLVKCNYLAVNANIFKVR